MNDKLNHILELLSSKGMTLTTIESCTGGYLASKITEIPGVSSIYNGGLITYQDWVKQKFVSVKEETIKTYDVVSEQVVREMVIGGCKAMNADIALATTGYAGPTGGTDKIPVGTIWIGCGTVDKQITQCLRLGNDRSYNIITASDTALNILIDNINDLIG